MRTIDIDRVFEDANTSIGLSTRAQVVAAMEIDDQVSHIESRLKVEGRPYVTVEMGSGDWLTIPVDALVPPV